MDFFKKIIEWFKRFPENYWKKFTQSQKILFIGTLSAIIIAIFIISIIFSNPNYTLLIGGLSDAEAGNVIQTLEEQNVPYKTTAGGSIYVPASYQPEALRMKLFTQGVLGTTSQGFEIFDSQPLGATSFDKQVRYQIALQGSLERSIVSIDGINYAKIHLTVPKFTYYTRGDETISKASVMLGIKPGFTLSSDKVKAIMELVAAAVEGLDYKNVRVVDNYSRLLSDSVSGDESMGFASSRMEIQKLTENYYTDKVRKSLEQVFGYGRVVVISEILLNWETIEKESKAYEPVTRTTGIVESEQIERESSVDRGTGAPVGVDSNVPPTYESTTVTALGQYEREKTIRNYNVNEAYEHILQNKQGEILDKNVTVLIDSTAVASSVNKDNIKTIVANAVSASITNVEVDFLAFDRSIEEQYESEMQIVDRQQKFVQLMIGFILLAGAMMLLVYLLIGRMRLRKQRQDIIDRRRKFEEELLAAVPEEKLSPEEAELVNMMETLFTAAESKPEEVALLLKVWLNE
jgi:flagellar M-ring protein FliF